MQPGDVQQAAQQILQGQPSGSEVFIADPDRATPHPSKNPDKGMHVDGWRARVKSDGSVETRKKWAPAD